MNKHRRKRACDMTSSLLKRLFAQELSARDFWTCYGVYGILVLVLGGSALSALLSRRALGVWSVSPVVLVLLALATIAVLAHILWRVRKDPARVFVLLALLAGVAFALLVVPARGPDEVLHIDRVFCLFRDSDTLIVPTVLREDALPQSYEQLYWAITAPFSSETYTRGLVMETNTDLVYVLPGLVAAVCNALSLNVFITVFLARLANLALFLVAGYYIIRLLPFGKVIMCVYMLSPMCLQQEASCSADALTNCASLLFIAYVLKLRFSERITKRQIGIVAAFFVVVLFCKPSYFFLIYLLLLLVPHLERKRRNAVYIGAIVVTVLGLIAVMVIPLPGYYGDLATFIRTDPLEALYLAVKSTYVYGEMWFWQYLGQMLASLDVFVWPIASLIYAFALFSTVFVGLDDKVSFTRKEKVGIIIGVALFLLVLLMAFRSWSVEAVGITDVIAGFQGRYVIPVLILVFLAFFNAQSYLKRPNCLLVYTGCLMVVYLISFVTLTRFY